ncbi:MAG: hypothetical protein HC908_08695 [Calothrix sp. SM1_7_51]|nr:hypothetical protein [Calothrix sp. SM1_7_51]
MCFSTPVIVSHAWMRFISQLNSYNSSRVNASSGLGSQSAGDQVPVFALL